ncbi:MAG: hypothetical protein ABFS42_07595 [Candidatus Krumholzibacteriota bacterium]
MSRLISRIFARLVKTAGGRPEVVLPLYHGIEKAAEGSYEILRQSSRRKQAMSASAWRTIFIVITALGSVFLSLTMLIDPADHHPHWGVLILVGAHWLLVVNMVVSLAGPSLLVDDDFLAIGWWPVTARELLLARLGTILKPALQITLALGTVPLLVYAITGRPPLISAVTLAAGLTIQTLGVTFGVGTALALVVRLRGRRRAQRLAALVADGNTFLVLWLLGFMLQRLHPWFMEHSRVLYALPLTWFAAFGDLQVDAFSWSMAALGVTVTLVMITAGFRLMAPSGAGQEVQPVEKRPSRWHYSAVVSWLVRPLMPGREGWVVRRLLESHLREDWRFIGGMATMPLMMGFMFFGMDKIVPLDLNPEDVRFTALLAIRNTHFLTLMAATVIFLASFSSTPKALWIVGLSDLETGGLLKAQRGMIRGLILAPVLALYIAKAAFMGVAPHIIALDCLVLGFQVEIIVSFLQPFVMIMPFSLAYTNEQTAKRIGLGLLSGAVALVFVLMNFMYAEFAAARIAVWVSMPLLLLGVRAWQSRRVAGRRLRMDVVN